MGVSTAPLYNSGLSVSHLTEGFRDTTKSYLADYQYIDYTILFYRFDVLAHRLVMLSFERCSVSSRRTPYSSTPGHASGQVRGVRSCTEPQPRAHRSERMGLQARNEDGNLPTTLRTWDTYWRSTSAQSSLRTSV